jgi:hypothetical protein
MGVPGAAVPPIGFFECSLAIVRCGDERKGVWVPVEVFRKGGVQSRIVVNATGLDSVTLRLEYIMDPSPWGLQFL